MLGFIAGGVTRGLLVGMSVAIAFVAMPGVTVNIHSVWPIVYFALSATVMLSLAGIMTGIWADKFDHSSTVTNFVIAPLTLLSGTFYSIERLDPIYQTASQLNPFFYMIDGFRYGFIGQADSDLQTGVIYILVMNIVLAFATFRMLASGYKLKA